MASRGTQEKAKKPGRSVQHVSPVEGADVELYRSRRKFLEILDEECPEAREELRDSVWPEYKKMFQELEKAPRSGKASEPPTAPGPTDGNQAELHESQAFNVWFTQARGDPAVKGFARTLDDWVANYHLEADWLRDTAIRTIRAWEQLPDLAHQSYWIVHQTGYWNALQIEEQEFTFSYPSAWDPTVTTWKDAKVRIEKAFRARLAEWSKERRRLAEARGYPEAPILREEEKHLRWLIRYQVVGESWGAIARSEKALISDDESERGTTSRNVGIEIKRTAERLGLSLRPTGSGGRPRKAR